MAKKTTKKATNDNAADAKPKKPRQGTLDAPGMERKYPELEAAFEEYDEENARRVAATNTTKIKFETVLETMREQKVRIHKFSMKDGTTATIKYKPGKDKFTVHKKKPEAFKDGGEE